MIIPPRHALLDTSQPQYCKLIALALSDQAPEKRAPFIVHVDELQSFSTMLSHRLLSAARKFVTHFCTAIQYLERASPQVRAAVLVNAATIIVFPR